MCIMQFQGALEEILSVCTTVLEKGSIVPLDNERRSAITELGLSLNDEVSARASPIHLEAQSLLSLSLITEQGGDNTSFFSLTNIECLHALHLRMNVWFMG